MRDLPKRKSKLKNLESTEKREQHIIKNRKMKLLQEVTLKKSSLKNSDVKSAKRCSRRKHSLIIILSQRSTCKLRPNSKQNTNLMMKQKNSLKRKKRRHKKRNKQLRKRRRKRKLQTMTSNLTPKMKAVKKIRKRRSIKRRRVRRKNPKKIIRLNWTTLMNGFTKQKRRKTRKIRKVMQPRVIKRKLKSLKSSIIMQEIK